VDAVGNRDCLTEALMNRYLPILILMVTLGAGAPTAKQSREATPEGRAAAQGAEAPAVALPDGPQVLTDSGGQPFRVVPIKGLRQPWALAFLPDGDILVTELGGPCASSGTACWTRSQLPASRKSTRVSGVRG